MSDTPLMLRSPRSPSSFPWQGLPGHLLLVAIVLAGLTLRVWNVNFDRGIGSHPDERSTACFYAPTIGWPRSWDEFRDPQRSPLNPLWDRAQDRRRSFTYGHFPLYLGVGLGHLLHKLASVVDTGGVTQISPGIAEAVALMARANRACDAIAVAGRLTIALLDTVTILLVYLLARRWTTLRTGPVPLLAAAFYAFTAQAVQLSHFFAMDPASTTFTVLAVLGAVDMAQRRTLGAAVVAGIGAGLAISSKFSALPILAAPVVGALVWMATATLPRQSAVGTSDDQSSTPVAVEADLGEQVAEIPDARSRVRGLVGLFLALGLAVTAFVVTSPYAVLDWRNFIQATLVEQGQMVRGVADFPFTRQYRNTTPYVYFIEQQVKWGMGLPLGLTALAGTLVAAAYLVVPAWYVLRRRASVHRLLQGGYVVNLVAWSWLVPYFGLTGAFLAKFNRYMSPVLPFMVLFGAVLVGLLWNLGQSRRTGSRQVAFEDSGQAWAARGRIALRSVAVLLAVTGLIGGAGWSLAYVNGVYQREHTWITASRWIYENAPSGSVLLWELWDDPLPKTIPGEPGMDMGTTGLRNIDWSPYEEDTAEKYAILKAKLREADFVVYSSKRIYDSVDELPERYPMTILYYEAMWDGRLGFELAAEFTSPPRLFGLVFDDRRADESWSLYDHPQVTVFRKVRDLSDAEFDALFDRAWERAIPYYRGADSPLSPVLELLGLGSSPGASERGIVSRVVQLLSGEAGAGSQVATREVAAARLQFDRPLAEFPVVDNYRWNRAASESTVGAILVWWVVVFLLGIAVWPLAALLFAGFPDGGYLIARGLGWLLAGWLLWMGASAGIVQNTVQASWWALLVVGMVGAVVFRVTRRSFLEFVKQRRGLLLFEEGLWTGAFLCFVLVRIANPDLWQPWFGGEKFMEFAFLNGILRSPTFPPVDPHFAGGFINYYYYGIYLVAYVIKLTGLYAEVAYNLAIPTLFALTVGNAFSVAHAAWSRRESQPQQVEAAPWWNGVGPALLAPFLVTVVGNLEGFAQAARQVAERSSFQPASAVPGLRALLATVGGFVELGLGRISLPGYDFWGPSRVIPATINEFPYWSFLFADLHPHMIGVPFSLLFLAALLSLFSGYGSDRAGTPARWVLLAFLLGTLAAVNLWELPTYFGLGVLALLVAEVRHRGRVRVVPVFGMAIAYLGLAFGFFLPFFRAYVNVGASGPGWVRAGDPLGSWLLMWGTLGFVVASGLAFFAYRAGGPHAQRALARVPGGGGVARWVGISLRRFERLPRVWYLHRLVVKQPTVAYLLGVASVPTLLAIALAGWVLDRQVFALCVALLAMGLPLLWERPRELDEGATYGVLLAVTGLAILAGTQVVYLKDFLQGGDWYRMNTLFKFFIQVWVLWGVAGAIFVARLWPVRAQAQIAPAPADEPPAEEAPAGQETGMAAPRLPSTTPQPQATRRMRGLVIGWQMALVILLILSSTYLVLGTPARLSQRLVGWRPPLGTLNGLDFMDGGSYTWPNDGHRIELRYDVAAIRWLLDTVRGNVVIVESAEVDYYRAGGTRVASMTGLSGLRGMHAGEQRPGSLVGARDALHREFWATPSIERTLAIIDELQIALIYVGQLERHQHPEGVAKLAAMVEAGRLQAIYENPQVSIYAVPGRLAATSDGLLVPSAALPSVGARTSLRLDATARLGARGTSWGERP